MVVYVGYGFVGRFVGGGGGCVCRYGVFCVVILFSGVWFGAYGCVGFVLGSGVGIVICVVVVECMWCGYSWYSCVCI